MNLNSFAKFDEKDKTQAKRKNPLLDDTQPSREKRKNPLLDDVGQDTKVAEKTTSATPASKPIIRRGNQNERRLPSQWSAGSQLASGSVRQFIESKKNEKDNTSYDSTVSARYTEPSQSEKNLYDAKKRVVSLENQLAETKDKSEKDYIKTLISTGEQYAKKLEEKVSAEKAAEAEKRQNAYDKAEEFYNGIMDNPISSVNDKIYANLVAESAGVETRSNKLEWLKYLESTTRDVDRVKAELDRAKQNLDRAREAYQIAALYSTDTMDYQPTDEEKQKADALYLSVENARKEYEKKKAELEKTEQNQIYLDYYKLMLNPDFAENSKYRDQSYADWKYDPIAKQYYSDADPVYGRINGDSEAINMLMMNELKSKARWDNTDTDYIDYMDKDEIAIYNYLYHTQGKESASEFLDKIKPGLKKRELSVLEKEIRERASNNKITDSAFSVLMSPTTLISFGDQVLQYLTTGKIDETSHLQRFSQEKTWIRDEVSKDMSSAGRFFYSTGMSMLDNLWNIAITGGFSTFGSQAARTASSNLTLAIMGSEAAAQSTLSAKERGLNDDQAFALGIISGLAEVITEKVSLDRFFSGEWDGTIKSFVKYIKNNGFVEGTEEVNSDLINFFADILIAQDESEFQKKINKYLEDGDKEKAFWKALRDQLADTGLSFLGGLFSGVVMSGGNAVLSSASIDQNISKTTKIYDNAILEIKNESDLKTARALLKSQIEIGEKQLKSGELNELGTIYTKRLIGELKKRLDKISGDNETVLGSIAEERSNTKSASEKALDYKATNLIRKGLKEVSDSQFVLPTAEEDAEKARVANQQSANTTVDTESISIDDINSLTLTFAQQEVKKAATETQIEQAKAFQEAFGWEVRLYSKEASSGKIENSYLQGQTFYVNVKAAKTVPAALGHELMHTIENTSAYKELTALVSARLSAEGKSIDSLISEAQDRWGDVYNGDVSSKKAMQEVLADYVGDNILNNVDALVDVAKKSPQLWSGIKYFVNKSIAKLTDTGYRSVVKEAKQILANIEKADKTAKAYYAKNQAAQNVSRPAQDAQTNIRTEVSDAAIGAETREKAPDSGKIIENEVETRQAQDTQANSREEVSDTVRGTETREKAPVSGKITENEVEERNREITSSEGFDASTRVYSVSGYNDLGNKYSISATLKDDLQKVLDGTFESNKGEIYIGETSNFLVDEIEADSLPVTMPANKAYSAMVTEDKAKADGNWRSGVNYHGLGKDGLYNALVASENPVAVFVGSDTDEENRGNRLVIVTDYKKNDVPVVVVQEFETKGRLENKKITANKDITVYERKKLLGDILDASNDRTLLYLDKKRSQKLFAGRPGSNYLAAIRTADFKDSIRNFWGNVKWLNGKNNGNNGNKRSSVSRIDDEYMSLAENYENLSEEEKAKVLPRLEEMVKEAARRAFPNTKVIDENGDPLVVYHGSDEYFDEFDIQKGRSTMDIQGSFFSPWEIDAQGYGKNVRRFFLNITNPAGEREGYRALNTHKGENYAGVKARTDLENQGYDGVNNGNEEYIAFYPSQIKSADPITYDDNGNVIPLSERFDDESNDIRWSVSKTSSGDKFVTIEDESINKLLSEKGNSLAAKVRSYFKRYQGKVLPLGSTDKAYISSSAKNEYTNPAKRLEDEEYDGKLKAASELENLLSASEYINHLDDDGRHHDAVRGWNYYSVVFVVPDDKNQYRAFSGVISIKLTQRGDVFYDITKIKDISSGTDGYTYIQAAISTRNASDTAAEGGRGVTRNGSLAGRTDAVPDTIVSTSAEKINTDSSDVTKMSQSEHRSSVSRTDEDKSAVIDQLRSYLDGKISRDELNSSIDAIDNRRRGASNNTSAKLSEAQQLVRDAHAQQMSVEEYLEENAELYDNDGRWNKTAREALRLEETGYDGKMYSVSDVEGSPKSPYSLPEDLERAYDGLLPKADEATDALSVLNSNARAYYRKNVEKPMRNKIKKAFRLPYSVPSEAYTTLARMISNRYTEGGELSERELDEIFEYTYAHAYDDAVDFVESTKEAGKMRGTTLTLTEEEAAAFSGKDPAERYSDFFNFGEGGISIAEAYETMKKAAPGVIYTATGAKNQLKNMVSLLKARYNAGNMAMRKTDKAFDALIKADFKNAVTEQYAELAAVKRYVEDRKLNNPVDAPINAAEKGEIPTELPEIYELYNRLDNLRKGYIRAESENLLTSADKNVVKDLLRGDRTVESLPQNIENREAILAVYEAKKAYNAVADKLFEYKTYVKALLLKEANESLKDLSSFKNKHMASMMREAPHRVFREVGGDAIAEKYYKPITKANADIVHFIEEYNERIRALGISTKVEKGNTVSESYAVQFIGEAEDNIRQLEKSGDPEATRGGLTLEEWNTAVTEFTAMNPNLDKEKIDRCIKAFHEIYDELFAKLNDTLVRNGYDPIQYRSGYFPHFNDGEGDGGLLSKLEYYFGIDLTDAVLPTAIAGRTETFKPGKQWFSHLLERKGKNTSYDALQGFDKYIAGAANVIFKTDNIQRLRALARQIRYLTSDESIREQIDAIRRDNNRTEQQRESDIQNLLENGRYALSEFVQWLDEYTNIYAGKKSFLDRSQEKVFRRKSLSLVKSFQRRNASNMVGGNIASAVTNFIPINQAATVVGTHNILKAMVDQIRGAQMDADSVFMASRGGYDTLYRSAMQKFSDVLATPMDMIDGFTTGTIVRAAYAYQIKHGMNSTEAMEWADQFAADTMGGRSAGEQPTLFETRNVVLKLFTQFQLEVNNEFSVLFKDIPLYAGKGKKDKWVARAVAMFMRYFIGAWMFNELYEFFFGRRSALDPIDIVNDFVGNVTGKKLPNIGQGLVDVVHGEEFFAEQEKKDFVGTVGDLTQSIAEELPFSAVIGLIDEDFDGGRLPVSAAIPNVKDIATALSTRQPKKIAYEAIDELSKPLSLLLLPTGGNQLQKTLKGAAALARGGSYKVNNSGEEYLQYAVDPTFGNVSRALVFGKSSLPTAREWVDRDFESLTPEQTAAYMAAVRAGDDDGEDVFDAILAVKHFECDDGEKPKEAKTRVLFESGLSDDAIASLYTDLIASDKEKEAIKSGYISPKLIAGISKEGTSSQKYEYLAGAGLTSEEAIAAINYLGSGKMTTEKGEPTTAAKMIDMIESGADPSAVMLHKTEGYNFDKAYSFMESGVPADESLKLESAIANLEPEKGRSGISDLQKYEAVIDSGLRGTALIDALSVIMNGSTYNKVLSGNVYGVTPDTYIKALRKCEAYDENLNGKYTQYEIKQMIDKEYSSLSAKKKAVLWQMLTGADSAAKNPYNMSAGEEYLKTLSLE